MTAAVRWHGGTRLNPSRLLGCLAGGAIDGRSTLLVGLTLRLLGGTLLLPILYVAMFEWVGRADAGVGGLVGFAHALLMGLAFPLLFGADRCGPPPGIFGWRLGALTPVVLLLSYGVYGALLGYIYILPA